MRVLINHQVFKSDILIRCERFLQKIQINLTIITYQGAVLLITQTSDSPVNPRLHFDNQSLCGHIGITSFPEGLDFHQH